MPKKGSKKELQEKLWNKGIKITILGEYVNSTTKIQCLCETCGHIWEATPGNLTQGWGCPKCRIEKIRKKNTKTIEKFIEQASKVHNNYYNYSKSEYINDSTKICIICPKHGEFWQTPSNHLQKHGCPKCAIEKEHDKHRFTLEDFIKKSKEAHGDIYDYSKTVYKDSHTPVTIVCKKHGEFTQLPYVHWNGKGGCPLCNGTNGEILIGDILNNLNIKFTPQYRINIYERLFIIDFYIQLEGKDYFIEYNGVQHYIPQHFFGGELKFKKQVDRDESLRKYCTHNNINLLEIPYTDKRDVIVEKIKTFLYGS